ncbi:MAG: choice-of-anchor tandem repeat NxxGxxAF-containing protein [Planctomycetota bacterium]
MFVVGRSRFVGVVTFVVMFVLLACEHVEAQTRVIARASDLPHLAGDQAPGTDGSEFRFFSVPTLNSAGDVAFRAMLKEDGGAVDASNRSGLWTTAGGDLRLVVREGDDAPGTDGADYEFLSSFPKPIFSLNVEGDLLFGLNLQRGENGVDLNNNKGIWRASRDTVDLLARTGDEAPGTGGAIFYDFATITRVNETGHLVFSASLRRGQNGVDFRNNSGIWATVGGSFHLIARTGDEAPGTGGAVFSNLPGASVVMNSAGDFVFSGSLEIGGDVDTNNSRGIWGTSGGVLGLITRQGSEAPGTGGAVFESFAWTSFNAKGDLAIRALLDARHDNVDSKSRNGLWVTSNGVLRLVARADSEAPGVDGAKFSSFSMPILNDASDLAFHSTLRWGENGVDPTNDDGIWMSSGGPLRLIAREGSEAPGTDGARFHHFFPSNSGHRFNLNASGDLAFRGLLREGENGVDFTNDEGIWMTSTDSLRLIAREDSDAPGTGGADFMSFSPLAMNASGDLAFMATLQTGENGVNSRNWRGLWAYSSFLEETILIAREGDLFDVSLEQDGSDLRTISTIHFYDPLDAFSGLETVSGLNDAGDIVYVLEFRGGASGIFVTTLIPSPGAISLFSLMGPALARRRRC